MEGKVPEWFNKDFLKDCLQNKTGDKGIMLSDFQIASAVPPGNNFGSVVVRITLKYKLPNFPESEEFSKKLVAKLPLSQSAVKDVFGDTNDKEFIFYRDYLPLAYKALNHNFAPLYYPSSSKLPAVVLEDLKDEGYVMADRLDKLDFEHCQLYANAAAAFHAGSFAVFKENPNFVKSLGSEKMFSKEKSILASVNITMIRYSLECMADSILKTIGDERVVSILNKCSVKLWDMLVETVKPQGFFNTLNQGDPWLTNMMFKHDTKSIKILDFQALRFSSPASDLSFFLWSSAQHSVREERLEDFYRKYIESLNGFLQEAGCSEQLTLDILKEDLLKWSPQVLWVVAACFPLTQSSAAPDVEGVWTICQKEYSSKDNPFCKYFNEDFCKNHLIRLVNQMKTQKIFDYLETYMEKF